MFRIRILGFAGVRKNGAWIEDPAILRTLDGVHYDEELFTDYLVGTAVEDALREALEPGGSIACSYPGSGPYLVVATEFRARRKLSTDELGALVTETMGHWADGVGQRWVGVSNDRYGYAIQCFTPGDPGAETDYPTVLVEPV